MKHMCMVDINGRMMEILQSDREANEGEFKVDLGNYYEVLNEQRFPDAMYSHDLETWVGVGEQRPLPVQEPSEVDTLKSQVIMLEDLVAEIAMKVYE